MKALNRLLIISVLPLIIFASEIIRSRNYAFKAIPTFPDSAIVMNCNLSRAIPFTELPQNVKAYVNCNLLNCDPGEVPVQGGLWIQKDYCWHLHKDIGLDTCAINCRHVSIQTDIYADGDVVDSLFEYEDVVLP